MKTLLVLGSKPDPVLPPHAEIDALACANASGRSAAMQGLPRPIFTVMSAILTSGIESGRQSIAALAGLETGTLWYYARPKPSGSFWRRWRKRREERAMRPDVLRARLAEVGYRFDAFEVLGNEDWRALVIRTAGDDEVVRAAVARKQPSTGVAAIALGLDLGRWSRVCLAGFSFELTHAYADNPEIGERGTNMSKHADTDIAALRAMVRQHPGLCTSEPIVHERTGIPLLAAAGGVERP